MGKERSKVVGTTLSDCFHAKKTPFQLSGTPFH
jgi:hypothetical protein